MNAADHSNSELGDLSITFKLDETLLNYFFMASYVMNMRYGINDSKDFDYRMKKNVIKKISISILDNQKNVCGYIHYDNCIPSSISGIEVNYYTADEIEFTVSFKFQEVHFGNKD